jgi:hypothetical protein
MYYARRTALRDVVNVIVLDSAQRPLYGVTRHHAGRILVIRMRIELVQLRREAGFVETTAAERGYELGAQRAGGCG